MDLIGRYKLARKETFNRFSKMKRNKRRKRFEIEAAYLLRNIQKYVRRDHPELLEYVLVDIDKLESLGKK